MKYYIAYGSNLNVGQMEYRCPLASFVGTATLKDWRLVFKGSGSGNYLTIEPCEGRSVPVAIWKVTSLDEKNLDRYEGFPHFYYKKDFRLNVTKVNHEREELDCFAYIMAEDRKYGMPGQWYVQTCSEGYEDCGFDRRVLVRALNDTMKELQNQERGWH